MDTPPDHPDLERVFRSWVEGAIAWGEFSCLDFENLTPENVDRLTDLAGPEEMAYLRSQAADLPTTDDGWSRVLRVASWCGPWNNEIAEQQRRQEQVDRARFRRGVETFRRRFG